ncbi:MAG TPA: Holliday junction branch migration DNA helicase RuvB [Candidatus Peribacter riflensis]|nr:MAG: holliday junction DNA helicase RuvB [Candidatus Peribacter riflensis]OGJ78973.1 MAG: Holliday junction DNA helicase RuvB [Candidatus Peribacteria bacterium RIFOXYB1_FULL_57_12]OGJ80642.1 MAG: Holliday junction DNA helicase RuvB [Candidatus Peribacteria bacterium RIFOXYC1_FULL_58_8]HBH19977.1 Holliday junction branch migration DNA helicase RuvB [Candidatus Peribacter riflensis]HBU09769.1 Holliday junction branch migration DNA helicase RuvB [Candidatus Peribacter riflensis]
MALAHHKRHTSAATPTKTAREGDTFEQTLRPKTIAEYVGQSDIKGHLLVHIAAAKTRAEPLGHTLLHGSPGLGKTTLAHILAHEMGAQIRITSGPAIEKPGDLASMLTNLQQGDVLFIDEIHRLKPVIEEVLYSAMEDYALDLVIGKGPSARSMRLTLKPFTLIGATTKAGSVSAPLRDRFIHNFKLSFYTLPEMEQIVLRSARILHVALEDGAADLIGSSSRATPRISNRLVRAIRDFAQVKGEKDVSLERVRETLEALGIDDRGLDRTDRAILQAIIEKFQGGPVGVSTLAAATAEEEETLEDVYEPYLLQQGYLQRTPKGRVATPHAYSLLGISMPESAQKNLFVG